jgi:hypothetical protein
VILPKRGAPYAIDAYDDAKTTPPGNIADDVGVATAYKAWDSLFSVTIPAGIIEITDFRV